MTKRLSSNKGVLLLLVMFSLILFFTACSFGNGQSSSSGSQTQAESQIVADSNSDKGVLSNFTTTDIDDNAVNQEILQGKKLNMINVWATYCGNCLREMPQLNQLNQEYADQGLQIIGIPGDIADFSGNIDSELLTAAREIVAQTGAAYVHVLPSPSLNKDFLNQVSSVPTTIFVDEKGRQLGKSYVGARSLEQWQPIIDELLRQQGELSTS